MNERPTFMLDGVEVPFEPGQTVMQAALAAGRYIPPPCYDPEFMQNDPTMADLIRQAGADLLGGENVLPFRKELGAEDFGCFSELAPGAMFPLDQGGAGPALDDAPDRRPLLPRGPAGKPPRHPRTS